MTLFSRFGTFTAGIVAWAVTAPVVFAAGEWPQDNGRP